MGNKSFRLTPLVILVLLALNLAVTLFLVIQMLFVPRSSPQENQTVTNAGAELKAIQKYHGDVISTVWGSLAAISTVIVVVTAGGVVLSIRTYENDKASMLASLSNIVAEQVAKQVDAKVNEERKTLEKSYVEFTKRIEAQLVETEQRISEELARTSIELTKQVKDTSNRLLRVDYQVQRLQALRYDIYSTRPSPDWAMKKQIGRLDVAIELFKAGYDPDERILYTLQDLERLSNEMTRIGGGDGAKLIELLNKVPETWAETASRIAARIRVLLGFTHTGTVTLHEF